MDIFFLLVMTGVLVTIIVGFMFERDYRQQVHAADVALYKTRVYGLYDALDQSSKFIMQDIHNELRLNRKLEHVEQRQNTLRIPSYSGKA